MTTLNWGDAVDSIREWAEQLCATFATSSHWYFNQIHGFLPEPFFNTQAFLKFFALVFTLYWLIPRRCPKARIWLLVAASFHFYAAWSQELAFLVLATTIADYVLGRFMSASERRGLRFGMMLTSIAMNLGVLSYFKYRGFFLNELHAALEHLGCAPAYGRLDLETVIVPFGISFYTFEAISYTVDVYRRQVAAFSTDQAIDIRRPGCIGSYEWELTGPVAGGFEMPSRPFPGLRSWPLQYSSSLGQRRGRWLKYASIGEPTTFLDLETWPPDPVGVDTEYVSTFDVLPDGRLVVCSTLITSENPGYMVRIHPLGWPAAPKAGPPEVIGLPPTGVDCEVWVIGERVIAFSSHIAKHNPPAQRQAYALKEGRFRAARSLPTIQNFDKVHNLQQFDNGKVTLADGAELLIWDGNGYEVKRGSLKQTWSLEAKNSFGVGGWNSVPWGRDGFFYLSDRRVMYVRRGKKPVPVLPDAENVMYLSPGPERSIIASQGKNRKGLAARVWFPLDGSYIPITRKDLGVDPHSYADELYWSAATRHVYTRGRGLVTFPDSDLLARDRIRPRGAGYTVEPAE